MTILSVVKGAVCIVCRIKENRIELLNEAQQTNNSLDQKNG